MFLRFISGEIDEDSRLSAGLFSAADKLLTEVSLSDYDDETLKETMDWFEVHLKNPYRFRLEQRFAKQSICWFRATAKEHLHRAWQMVAILEEHDISMRMIKSHRPGHILYEDDAQVLAYPYPEMRQLL